MTSEVLEVINSCEATERTHVSRQDGTRHGYLLYTRSKTSLTLSDPTA